MSPDRLLQQLDGVKPGREPGTWMACCPGHRDRNPSLSIRLGRDGRILLKCFGGCDLDGICAALGITPADLFDSTPKPVTPRPAASKPRFTADDAGATWDTALSRARDDHAVRADKSVYEYLTQRGLACAWNYDALGILGTEMSLPKAISWWPGAGYRLVAPLYDNTGTVVNVQARAVTPRDRKTLFPAGSRVRGAAFADERGRDVLTGNWAGRRAVIVAEGLTDHLALTIASPVPVISAPGTGMAISAIGPWVTGFHTYLAMDQDAAGENAVGAAARAVFRQGGARVTRVVWPEGANDACDTLAALGEVGFMEFLDNQFHGEEVRRERAA